MGISASGGCDNDAGCEAIADATLHGTVQIAGESPRPVVISRSGEHGLVVEGAGDLAVGCEVTILLREICSIRGQVEAFGRNRLVAGLLLKAAITPTRRLI
jgi:hypothetical protein